jgi:DNA-3-methyladenine glycosylase
LGISKVHSGILLRKNELYIADDGFVIPDGSIGISRRIGVEGAGETAAALPYRFYVKGNKYVSSYPNK